MAKQHVFSQVPRAQIQRSVFDRSHDLKTTFDAGFLVPIYVDEVLPGDSFKLNATLFGRVNTPITPIMDNLYLDTHFFAVPIRLIWDNWQKFNGEQDRPGDSTDYLIPQVKASASGFKTGELEDYFGIPIGVKNLSVSALWHRAYNLIFNEWFRDENLVDPVPVHKGDGPDPASDYKLLRRGKRHDYFTSCLPWPQKGAAVEIPLAGQAPIRGNTECWVNVKGTGKTLGLYDANGKRVGLASIPSGGNPRTVLGTNYFNKDLPAYSTYGSSSTSEYGVGVVQDDDKSGLIGHFGAGAMNGWYADLANINIMTINALREAFQIQRLFERDARGGTRYTEIIRSHFGVTSPDARLQRPEYLGGGTTRIDVSPVAQTSASDTTSPQGNLAAIGTVVSNRNGFTKSFTEHCVLVGLASVRADLTYQQGLNRMFSRQTRWDFYWPALAHLGEQAVLNKEIYADGSPVDNEVFGYQERYAEYRYKPSQITGVFRSKAPGTLDVWHLSQNFASRPLLNEWFITERPPLYRVVSVPSQPHLLLDCHFALKCARPMPVYSVPGLIDHF